MENLGKEFQTEKSTDFKTPRSINPIAGTAPVLDVTTGASEEEIYLRSLREESIKDAIEFAELDRLEIREKIKAKKAAIAVAESETAMSLFKLATNEALRVEYIENSEKIFDDLRSKAEIPVSPKSARSSG